VPGAESRDSLLAVAGVKTGIMLDQRKQEDSPRTEGGEEVKVVTASARNTTWERKSLTEVKLVTLRLRLIVMGDSSYRIRCRLFFRLLGKEKE